MDIEDFHVRNQKKEKLEQRKEAAEITQKLLQVTINFFVADSSQTKC